MLDTCSFKEQPNSQDFLETLVADDSNAVFFIEINTLYEISMNALSFFLYPSFSQLIS